MDENPPTLSRPIPDPTILTTQQLLREIGLLRELLESYINALRLLHEEKIDNVHAILKERDRQTVVRMGLEKEARDKIEISLVNQLNGIQKQLVVVQTALEGKIDDLKSRIAVIEGRM